MQAVFNMNQIAPESIDKDIARGGYNMAINGIDSSSKGRDHRIGGNVPRDQGYIDNIIALIKLPLCAIGNQLIDPTPQDHTNTDGGSRRVPAASNDDITAIGG